MTVAPQSQRPKILHFRHRSPERGQEDATLADKRPGEGIGAKAGALRPHLQFLVDDGVTCPPAVKQATGRRLPVRNRLGRLGEDRRLVEKTGEFGRVQV